MKDVLFRESSINGMRLKNRLIMAAMHLGYAENGYVTDQEYEFYRERAKGGVSAIVTVARVNAMAGPGDMISAEADRYMPGIEGLGSMLHTYSCRLIVQLFHCGRNSASCSLGENGDQDPIAPSPVPSPIYHAMPREMTQEEIYKTADDFALAALRCKENGVDAVEISCSAGYLLSEFLSPLTNLRTDAFGGNEENRMRFPRMVIQKVREAVGAEYPVILRISGTDMMPGGYGIDVMQRFCSGLEPGWIDAISVTGGWHEAPVPQITIQLPEGGYAYLAGAIKRVVDVPVIACNRIHSLKSAQAIMEKGLADYVASARAYLADPQFADKIQKGETFNPCQACNRGCIDRVLRGHPVRCAFNPSVGHEAEAALQSKQEKKSKKVLVIGGGPGGMEAARRAAESGCQVVLCTKDSQLGGQVRLAKLPPEKEHLQEFVDALRDTLEKLKIQIRYDTTVTPELIEQLKPDKVIVATGSEPIVPRIKGIDGKNVVFAEEVLQGEKNTLVHLRRGKTIIIGGGSVGLETALFLAMESFAGADTLNFLNQYVPLEMREQLFAPLDITVVEMDQRVGKTLGGTKWILMKQLKQLGVKIKTNTKVLSIDEKALHVETSEGDQFIPADHIVLAIGYRPLGKELTEYLEAAGYDFTVIGDAKKPADIMEALKDAYQIVC